LVYTILCSVQSAQLSDRMSHKKRAGCLTILSIIIIAVMQLSVPVEVVTAEQPSPVQQLPSAELNFDNVLQHVDALSSFGSRVLGYDGFFDAANYIKDYLTSLGLQVREETFDIVTPIVERCTITVEMPDGSRAEYDAYPLWPNHVNPCPYTSPEEGDRLIYVSQGLPEDFNGVDVEGAFVLMDFNNRWYWKNVAVFNGKGVIFIEEEETICTEAVQKTFSVPLNFPRLYVRGEAASALRNLISSQGELHVWIDSHMVWETKTVSNIVAVVEGTDPALRNEVAVIGAYYDSWSIVPQLAPGATDAMGVAFLLEVARLFTENPPQRTVWLVAFAGHYQALVGAREFVDRHFNELQSSIKFMISFDLASDSDWVAAYAAGSMYTYNRPADLLRYYSVWLSRIFRTWLPSLETQIGETSHLIDGVLWTRPAWMAASPPFEPTLRYFEAEIFTEACYGGGLGFVTTNAFRIYQYTPLDIYSNIQPENLRSQVIFLWPILYNSANMPIASTEFPLFPIRVSSGSDNGLVSVELQLGLYNRTTDFFDDYAQEDAIYLVSVSPVTAASGVAVAGFSPAVSRGVSRSVVIQGATAGLFGSYPPQASGGAQVGTRLPQAIGFTAIVKPDENGRYILKGLRPYTIVDAQAYIIDPDTGAVLAATDTGPFGTGKLLLGGLFGQASSAAAPTLTPGMGGIGYLTQVGAAARGFDVYVPLARRIIPIFNTSSIALVGLFDPGTVSDAAYLSGISVYNFVSHSYFVWRDILSPWPEAMVFIQPDALCEIAVNNRDGIVAVFNNASDEYPQGQGYRLDHGETIILTLLDAADQMFRLSQLRGGFLQARMSANPRLVLYLEKMDSFYELANEARQSGDVGKAYSYSIAAWQFTLNTYSSSRSLIDDVVQTATFFFFISAAFVIFLARLISRRESGIKRMIIIILLFLGTNFVLSLVHPGYSISSNVWMLINGLGVILFTFLLFYIVVDELNTAIRSVSKSVLGFHRSDIERGSLIISALSMGIENLKKRPMRTGLALSTIIITISAMTLFTTMGVAVQSYRTSRGTAPYAGLLLKRSSVVEAMGTPISEMYLIASNDIASEGLAKLQTHPRAWIYPTGRTLTLMWEASLSSVRAILAMTPDEAELLRGAIVPGGGDVFPPDISRAVLMTQTLANGLGADLGIEIRPGARINLYGINVTVMGILDDNIAAALLNLDLDQNPITPPDPSTSSLTSVHTPVDISTLLIVPYQFAVEYLNVQPNLIALQAETGTLTEDSLWSRAFDLVLTLPFDISYGVQEGNPASVATRRDLYSLSGAQNFIMPLLLSSLTILSMMLSSVYERTREIATLSTVGLSPRHIGAIFIMESMALAFLGSVLGYITGAGITSILWNLNLFPEGLVPNVSSAVVIIVMGIMMAATMLSSIYPMTRASKLATPSLLRKWRIGSKPVGNQWSVGLPFNATPDEALGILTFMREYFEASASERTGVFMLLKPVQLVQEERARRLVSRLQLAPFDAALIQDLHVICRQLTADRYGFEILISRIEGVEQLWITANKTLLNEIRKQFLIWRALSPIDKQRYIDRAKEK
jgi:hypothetical protein